MARGKGSFTLGMMQNTRKRYWIFAIIALGSLLTVACGPSSPNRNRTTKSSMKSDHKNPSNAKTKAPTGSMTTARSAAQAPKPLQNNPAFGQHTGKIQTVKAVVKFSPYAGDTMRSATFVDPSHGWIVVGDRIMATRDGGRTWRQVSTVDGVVHNIGFFSARHGWLFTGDRLKFTEDGGRTWCDESVPHVAGITLRQAQFTDEEHGWILGTGEGPMIPDPRNPEVSTVPPIVILWSTSDGGKTWSRLDVPAKIANHEFPGYCYFSFISPDQGWLIEGSQPGTGQQGKFLYRTTDGGHDWTEVTSVGFYGPPQPKNGLPGGGYITGLDFVNDRMGLLTEDRGPAFITTDGGRSWKGLNTDHAFSCPDLLDAAHGFVIRRNILFGTRNGGVTWRQVYPALWPTPESVSPGLKACFWNAQCGVAMVHGAVLTTEDGGVTWRKTGPAPGSGDVIDFSFPDARHGWVITEGFSGDENNPIERTIYQTSDGGLTWRTLRKTSDSKNLYADISFVNDETGFVASGWGHLWVTHDGGRTLQVVSVADSNASRFQFVSAVEGWKMQDHGLYATTDGGHAWRRIALDSPVADFDLVTASAAWAITASSYPGGYHPQLLSTTDGGENWTVFDLGSVNPAGIAFADAKHGWMVDDQGNRYHTTDGGETWTEIDPYAQITEGTGTRSATAGS